jgi:hypothetical protein
MGGQSTRPWKPRPRWGAAVSRFRRAQAVVGGLYGELPHRRDPDVDGNGLARCFQSNARAATVATVKRGRGSWAY